MRRRTVVLLVAAAILIPGTIAAVPFARRALTLDEVLPADRPCPPIGDAADPAPPAERTLRLRPVGAATSPTSAVFAPDDSGDGFLGQRAGQIVQIRAGHPTEDVVLDLSEDTQQEGDGGLLALAYDPDGEWLYVFRATAALDDVVTAYRLDDDGLPDPAFRAGDPPERPPGLRPAPRRRVPLRRRRDALHRPRRRRGDR